MSIPSAGRLRSLMPRNSIETIERQARAVLVRLAVNVDADQSDADVIWYTPGQ